MATSTISRTPNFRGNFYFHDGVILTGILAALLYLIVGTALDAAGHVESMALLIPVTLGATVLGIMMSYSRFDGFFALSHSMFTGLAWILFLMSRTVSAKEIESFLNFGIPQTQAKVYYVLWKLLTWVDAAMSNSANNDNYVFVFEISFLLWWLTYLGVWAIFRYGYTWRAIIPAGVVLLINTYYAPKSVIGFLVFFCLLGLLFLVRTNLAEQQMRWREHRIYFNQDITLDFLRNGLTYSIIVLGVAWLVPGLGRNPQVRSILDPINNRWTEANVQISKYYGGLRRQAGSGTAAFGRKLSLGGERKVENTPIFTVRTLAGRYWRAVAFDTYDGRQWLNTIDKETPFDADANLPVPSWQMRTMITQTITLLAPTGNVIFGTQDIRRVNVPINALAQSSPADSAIAPQAQEITYARAQSTLDGGDSYTVVSEITKVTKRAMEGAGTDYPQIITDKYLQLPENFSERVAATAISVTVGAETPYDKAKAVETYLRTFKYNDAIPAPAPDQDPIEYFLYDVKEGYCDYYATAMVLMLRKLGIPSRAVSGYAEGIFDEESGVYFVTDKDAHTWVEVFFPTLGWVEFEPTAGESPLARPEDENVGTNNGLPDGAIATQTAQDGEDGRPEDFAQQQLVNQAGDIGPLDAQQTGGWERWLWLLLLPVLLVAGFWGMRRSQIFGPTAFTPELPPILYERLARWAERLGMRSRPSDTPYEHARSFSRVLPEGEPYIQTITQNYVHYRFSGQALTENGLASSATAPNGAGLVYSWQALNPLLWKAWMRKLLRIVLRRQENNPFTLVKPGRPNRA